MLYILFGENSFLLQQELQNIKNKLGDRELVAANTTLMDGSEVTLNRLISACDALPFLAPYRLVVVEGLLGRFEPKGQPSPQGASLKEETHSLAAYAKRMSPSTVLVLVDGKTKRDNPLLAALSPLALVRTFPLLRGAELQNWVRQQVAQKQGSIAPQAVTTLVQLVGENLWVMGQEIEKLLLYASGRRIEKDDVEKIVSYSQEANVFALVDALLERRLPQAGSWLHRLLWQGAAPAYLLTMITRQLRLLVQANEFLSQGLPLPEVQARLGLTNDYAFRQTLKLAKSYPMARLVAIYGKLLETDLSIKTGRCQPELALESLTVELCHEGTA